MMSTDWAKSSYSQKGADNCVECRSAETGSVAVRDTQHRDLGHLEFPATEWQAFLLTVRKEQM